MPGPTRPRWVELRAQRAGEWRSESEDEGTGDRSVQSDHGPFGLIQQSTSDNESSSPRVNFPTTSRIESLSKPRSPCVQMIAQRHHNSKGKSSREVMRSICFHPAALNNSRPRDARPEASLLGGAKSIAACFDISMRWVIECASLRARSSESCSVSPCSGSNSSRRIESKNQTHSRSFQQHFLPVRGRRRAAAGAGLRRLPNIRTYNSRRTRPRSSSRRNTLLLTGCQAWF